MNNFLKKSNISKTKLLIIIAAAFAVPNILLQFLDIPYWVNIILTITYLIPLYYGYRLLNKTNNNLQQMVDLCNEVKKGNLENRISKPLEPSGEIAELRNALNALIDSADGFTREALYTSKCILDNKFYRVILEKGLQGSYKELAKLMNLSMHKSQKQKETLMDLIKLAEDGVNAIAASTEQFTCSIAEIKNQVNSTVSITNNAQNQSESVNTNISSLLNKLS